MELDIFYKEIKKRLANKDNVLMVIEGSPLKDKSYGRSAEALKLKHDTCLRTEINKLIARNRMYNYHSFALKPPKNPTTEMNGAALNILARLNPTIKLTETKQEKLLRISKIVKEIAKELQEND